MQGAEFPVTILKVLFTTKLGAFSKRQKGIILSGSGFGEKSITSTQARAAPVKVGVCIEFSFLFVAIGDLQLVTEVSSKFQMLCGAGTCEPFVWMMGGFAMATESVLSNMDQKDLNFQETVFFSKQRYCANCPIAGAGYLACFQILVQKISDKKVNIETFERVLNQHILPHLLKELNSARGGAVACQCYESIDSSELAQVTSNTLCTIKCQLERGRSASAALGLVPLLYSYLLLQPGQ